MLVKELIEELQKLNQDSLVLIGDEGYNISRVANKYAEDYDVRTLDLEYGQNFVMLIEI